MTAWSGITTDIGGNPRVVGSAPDMGAWEAGGGTVIPPIGNGASWNFDEASGNALDGSGNGNTLVLSTSPAPTRVAGRIGPRALYCSGQGESATLPSYFNLTQEYTWAVWFKPDTLHSTTQDQGLFYNDDVWGFLYGANNACCWQLAVHRQANGDFVGGAQIPQPLQPGIWYYLTGRWTGTTLSVWLNGSLQASTPALGIWSSPSGVFQLCGTHNTIPGAGTFDNMQIWDTALSDTAIQAEYAKGRQARTTHQHRAPLK